MRTPRVSVICITYNQERYIRQTLESFVAQKAEFEFEVIVADDGSTDGTQAVIDEFSQQYPNVFKPIFRKKNIGALNNFYDALQRAQADYVALCEGDDFWTDPQKLQIQVDYMDRHPDHVICFHPVKVFFENSSKKSYLHPKRRKKSDFTISQLLKENYIQTNSVVYRRQDYSRLPLDIMPGDWYSHLFHAQFGKIGFIDRVMSSYRRHPGGLWWDSDKNVDALLLKYGKEMINFYEAVLKLKFPDKDDNDSIHYRLSDLIRRLYLMKDAPSTNLSEMISAKPEFIQGILGYQSVELKRREDYILYLDSEVKQRKSVIEQLNQQLHEVQAELLARKPPQSRTLKIIHKLHRQKRRES